MANATDLFAITRPCETVPGSLKWIAIIDPDDLVSLPGYWLLPNIVNLEFKPGRAPYAFEVNPFEGRMSSSTPSEAPGDYYQYTLNAVCKNIRLEVEYLRAKLRNRRVHLLVAYMDGKQTFVPNFRLFWESDTGTKSEPNQYRVTGSSLLRLPAPFIDGTIEIIGGLPGETTPPAGSTGAVQITTSDASTSYTIPAGKLLVAIFVRSTSDQTIAIGTTAGGAELSGLWFPMTALQSAIFGDNKLRTTTSTTIYFSGLQGTNTIELWLLG